MKGTLVIIDMQPVFETSQEPEVIKNCIKQILRAKKSGWGIVVLEYSERCFQGEEHLCSTDSRLLKALSNYDKVIFKKKSHDNGCYEVQAACKEKDFCTNNFRICGVNLGACVAYTVGGMLRLFPQSQIHIMRNAINGTPINPLAWSNASYQWNSYCEDNGLKSVKLVPALATNHWL